MVITSDPANQPIVNHARAPVTQTDYDDAFYRTEIQTHAYIYLFIISILLEYIQLKIKSKKMMKKKKKMMMMMS